MGAMQHEMWLKRARDKWYTLSMILSETDFDITVKDLCAQADFPSPCALRNYFDRWGDMLAEKYGKLPYRKINSSRYDKYMEMK